MTDLLSKLSTYNLFNYLLPGIVFTIFASNFTSYSFVQTDIVTGLFFYYFIGLVISRIGSLIVEPVLKRVIKFATYADYLEASKKDKNLKLCSEVNNTYRTFSSLFFSLLLIELYDWIQSIYPDLKQNNVVILNMLLLIIFLFAYKKQINYVRSRVKKANERG